MKRIELLGAVDGLLSHYGFQRLDSTWTRQRNTFADVIDIQTGNSAQGRTFNVALMHAPTYRLVWGEAPTHPPVEPECIVRTRVGMLLDGRDRWWPTIDSSASVEMAEALTIAALPFFAGFKELGDAERWLDELSSKRYPPEALYRAAVKHQLGKDEQAREILQQVLERTRSDPWQKHISKFAASLA